MTLPKAQPDTVFPHPTPDSSTAGFSSGVGISIQLTESGFGLGGLYRARVRGGTAAVIELSIGNVKDPREQQFFIGIFGDTVTPFKRSYVLVAPLQIGLEQRLFAEQIVDNFRPFAQVSAGPSLAYQWPYFRDANEDGVRDAGEELTGFFGAIGEGDFRLGVGGTVGVGAYFGKSRRSAQGVRAGYQASFFPREIDLLETDPAIESPSRRFFGSAVVSFHLIRLFN